MVGFMQLMESARFGHDGKGLRLSERHIFHKPPQNCITIYIYIYIYMYVYIYTHIAGSILLFRCVGSITCC